MSVIKRLRPVEALYILDEVDKEPWSKKNALAATLAFLGIENYIEPTKTQKYNINLQLTNKSEEGLRIYEKWCLYHIHKDDAESLFDSVNWKYIRNALVDEQFLRKEMEQRPFLWLFKRTVPVYYKTADLNQAVKELDELKSQIESAVGKKSLDKYLMSMSYAFPSSGLSDGFLEHAEHVIDVRETIYDTRLAIIAAGGAAGYLFSLRK